MDCAPDFFFLIPHCLIYFNSDFSYFFIYIFSAKPVKAFSDFTKDPMGEYRTKNAQQQNGRNAKSNDDSQSGYTETVERDDNDDEDGLKGKWYVSSFFLFISLVSFI